MLCELRAVDTFRLFEASHSNATVSLLSGHCNHQSFALFHSLIRVSARLEKDMLPRNICNESGFDNFLMAQTPANQHSPKMSQSDPLPQQFLFLVLLS